MTPFQQRCTESYGAVHTPATRNIHISFVFDFFLPSHIAVALRVLCLHGMSGLESTQLAVQWIKLAC